MPQNASRRNDTPRVMLVGAGPGDPGLLTLRGCECLNQADVVLYDGLSNTDILIHAVNAQKICVGKHGQSRIWKQHEIIDEMLRHARSGRRVVRLKGGDPAVFARTSEEVDALVAAGIEFEIVPGITAALAAGSYAGIPITHRGIASAVALVTGHEQPGKTSSDLDWRALAAFPGTLVIYMGVTTARTWTKALIDHGKDPSTPCAIIRRCSLNDQQTRHCRLDEVADHLTPATKLRPPVITIVGPVTDLAEHMDWFSKRPLLGKRVLISRPQVVMESPSQSDDVLSSQLCSLGAVVLSQPVMSIVAEEPSILDATLDRIDAFDWIVFSSRNGVRYLTQRICQRGGDARSLGQVRIAAVGTGTAEELWRFRLRADLLPTTSTGSNLAAALATHARHARVLSIRGNRGGDHFRRPLEDAGHSLEEVVVYKQVDGPETSPEVQTAIDERALDWITITSGELARRLHDRFGDALWQIRIAAISPAVRSVLQSLGGRDIVVAESPGMDSIIDAIIDAESHQAVG
ncbi:MAG: uroporphyrinogen-III C-methyltransferase [Planctomycetota bacterium]